MNNEEKELRDLYIRIMTSAEFNDKLISGYLELLKKLNTASKLDLISKLTKSVQSDLKDKSNSFEKSFGAWDKSDDAQKITEEIRSARSFNRNIEDL